MASASPSVEMTNVLVISNDGQKTTLFRLASDTTISKLKRLWEAEHEMPEGSIIRRVDGTQLDDYHLLSDIEEAIPGSKTITVSIEEAIILQVGLYKSLTDDMRTISVGLSSKPQDLHPQLRQVFNLGEDRLLRLRSRNTPLLYNRSFEHQNLESGASIFVDLGYKFDVTDEWTSEVSRHLVFSSEDAIDLLTDDDMPQRVLLDGLQINIHHDILNCLPNYYRRMTNLIVHRHQMRNITLLVNDFIRQRLVWPTDISGHVIQKIPPLKSEMFFEDERLPTDASMKQLQLPDHAVVHTKSSVSVKLSDGKRKVLKVSDLATVADIEAMVSSFEGTTHFMLTSGGRRLKTNEKIKAINDHSSIEVDRQGDTMIVHLSDRSVRFSTKQRKLRFTEVMRKVATNGRLKLKKLVRIPLQCKGCSRRICLEEEAFQTIPSKCCRVRSLVLTDASPPKIEDSGIQGSWPVRQKRVGEARLPLELVQTAKKTESAMIQHPPPLEVAASSPPSSPLADARLSPATPRRFLVSNPRNIGGRGRLYTELLLRETPTVGEVRKAVAAKLAVPLKTVEIQRTKGYRRRDGLRAFEVRDDRRLVLTFADSKGNEILDMVVTSRGELLKDSDPLLLVPGWRNVIFVFPKSPDSSLKPI